MIIKAINDIPKEISNENACLFYDILSSFRPLLL